MHRSIRLSVMASLCAFAAIANAAEPTRQAELSWSAVTQDTAGNTITGVTYRVYRGAPGAAKAVIANNLTALVYTDSARPVGIDCYQVTAVKDGLEGAPSTEGCKSYFTPAAPTLVVK